ncbi:MAG: hypothetical protein AAF729_10395 [Pseudomonadota bacterium]
MPSLVRLFITQGALGFLLSAVFVFGLLWFNVMNLAYLVTHTVDGPLAVFLLWFFNGLLFGSVQIGYVVFARAGSDE